MPFSNAKKQSILNAAITQDLYAGLSSTAVGSYDLTDDVDGGCTEQANAVGGYARQQIASVGGWNAATDADPSVKTNANDIEFPEATADWLAGGDVLSVPLFTAAIGGTFVGVCQITSTAKPILSGDIARFAAGTLSLSLT